MNPLCLFFHSSELNTFEITSINNNSTSSDKGLCRQLPTGSLAGGFNSRPFFVRKTCISSHSAVHSAKPTVKGFIMKAVISVIGKDSVGIIAKVSTGCAQYGVNILDISQTVLNGYFTMIMITDIEHISVPFTDFVDRMAKLGADNNLQIRAMHEDIFN